MPQDPQSPVEEWNQQAIQYLYIPREKEERREGKEKKKNQVKKKKVHSPLPRRAYIPIYPRGGRRKKGEWEMIL